MFSQEFRILFLLDRQIEAIEDRDEARRLRKTMTPELTLKELIAIAQLQRKLDKDAKLWL